MAKRARGSTSRPGQRAPLQRTVPTRPTTGAETPPRSGLTEDELARAAQLEAAILAEEKAAEDAARRGRDRSRRPAAEPVARGSLAVQAAAEYAYVARDIRRIAIVGGLLIATLLALWVIAQATGFGQG